MFLLHVMMFMQVTEGDAGAGHGTGMGAAPRKLFRCSGAFTPSDIIYFKRAFSETELEPIHSAIRGGRVLNVVGPRQPEAGKTTLLHRTRRGPPGLDHLQHRTVARSPRQ
jgi:hypothetical protein